MITGLSAFPLTPVRDDRPDLDAFGRLVAHLAAEGVDQIGALGSTGGYVYLDRADRRDLARTAVAAAGGVPVLVGVGALTTRAVLEHVEDAHDAGAAGVLLAPIGYQSLRPHEVLGLFEDVTARAALPVVVYDNPATTRVTMTEDLLAEIAALPGISSIKLSGVAEDPADAALQLTRLRTRIPGTVTLGISGDAAGARGLLAGCDLWYSVLAGLFPRTCLAIARAAVAGEADRARGLSAELEPVWALFARVGSYRAVSALAAETGVVVPEGLPRPVLPLAGEERRAVTEALAAIGARA